MINFKRLNLVLLSTFLSSSMGSVLFAQQVTSTYQPPATYQDGQIINSPVIQGQRVIQGQVIQGQVLQGQPVQGQVIQGQVIQGQPFIQGQPLIQGPVIQGRPIRGNVAQPQPSKQSGDEAANRAKIAEQAKSIKALTDENSRLSRVEETNDAMRKEYARLKKAYDDVSKELDELKINQAMKTAESTDSDAQQAKLNQLDAQYQKAVEQNGAMSGQIKLLTQENDEIKNRLKVLSAGGGDMTNLKSELNTANSRIIEIQQKNKTLAVENDRLQGVLQAATSEKEKLNMRFSTLSQQSDQLRTKYQTATETNTTLDQRVTELSTRNRDYLAALNSRPTTANPARTNFVADRPDSGLVAERDRILALNTDLENRNALLANQISELEGKIGSLNKTIKPTESLLAAAVPVVTTDASVKFNILNWLIPFLLIGLTIGLYVFLTEEDVLADAAPFTSTRIQTQNDADQH